MKEFFKNEFTQGYLTCFVVGFIVMLVVFHDEPSQKQIGHTKQELQEMKEACEKDLTRSENCIIVVSYKPEGKEEK